MTLFHSIIVIIFMTCSLAQASLFEDLGKLDNWSYGGDIIGETRFFPEDDKLDYTKELAIDFSSHFKLTFENDFLRYKLALLGRIGVLDDGRNVILQEENYVKIPGDVWTFDIGYQIHSWYIMEGFRVSDILNSKNLDGDYELTEKYGELTFSFEYAHDLFSLSVYYFPLYTDPYWPESSSRSAPKTNNNAINQANIASSVWVEGNNIQGDRFGHQGAIKLTKSFEDWGLDMVAYAVHHMDRTQPFITIANDLKLRGHHFRVTQSGVNLSKIYESWIFKFEGAFRDFASHSFQPILQGPKISPQDNTMTALGLENNLDIIEGISSTFYMEWQKIWGVDLELTEQYTQFQNDLFMALRSDFNDVMGRVLTLAMFLDLEKQFEYAFAATYSQRITDEWSLALGGRLVESLASSNPKGFDLFRDSDNLYLKLTRFY